mgnify:CR=1 FL=1
MPAKKYIVERDAGERELLMGAPCIGWHALISANASAPSWVIPGLVPGTHPSAGEDVAVLDRRLPRTPHKDDASRRVEKWVPATSAGMTPWMGRTASANPPAV